MDQRQIEFEEKLRSVCPNVYFQPPPKQLLTYPCIVYTQTGDNKQWGNNFGYIYHKQWSMTYITKSALDNTPNEIALWPMCEFNRAYTINGLCHTVYYIYY